MTDDRAKRPTMGGSFEPPFCCPNRTARQSTLLASFAHQGPEGDSAALSAPAYTQETNTTTGDHHAEHNTRRRTVHRRKHRGNN